MRPASRDEKEGMGALIILLRFGLRPNLNKIINAPKRISSAAEGAYLG
jgi:hypothetical protein